MSKLEKNIGDLSNEDIVNSLLEDFQNNISLETSKQEDIVLHNSVSSDTSSSTNSTPSKIHNPKVIDFDSNSEPNDDQVQAQVNNSSKNLTDINQEKDLDDDDEVDKVEKDDGEIDNEKTEEESIVEPSDDEGMDDTSLSEEEVKKLEQTAFDLKNLGNNLFKQKLWTESWAKYNEALRTCPKSCSTIRSVLYANRAAVYEKMDKVDLAISSCSKALALNPTYLKALTRRARLYRNSDKLDEALADYQTIVDKDPAAVEAVHACRELPQEINERNEKLKDEMLGKLKDLGNMILRPFGLSTNNFQMVQDPNSGGYSVNFKQPN